MLGSSFAAAARKFAHRLVKRRAFSKIEEFVGRVFLPSNAEIGRIGGAVVEEFNLGAFYAIGFASVLAPEVDTALPWVGQLLRCQHGGCQGGGERNDDQGRVIHG